MNKKYFLIPIFIILTSLCFIFSHCSMFYQGEIQSRFTMKEAREIGVLDFNQEGFLDGNKLGVFASDELTVALFINQKYKIVDRSKVITTMREKNYSVSNLNTRQIQELGLLLGADFLILGSLTQLDTNEINPEENIQTHLQVTFRILSSKDGSVIGMVSLEEQKKGEIKKIVSAMMKKMADAVKLY